MSCVVLFILQLWQAFVGVRTRRVETYYQDLLALDTGSGDVTEHLSSELDTNGIVSSSEEPINVPEKWKGQIEKVHSYIRSESAKLYFSYNCNIIHTVRI